MSNRKPSLNWVKNLGHRLRHLHNAPNSASSSPGIASVPEGKSGAISGVLDLTNIQNDCYDSVKSYDGLQASDAARRSNPSQPQGLADSTPARPADSTSPQAQVNPSSTQAPNNTGGSTQSKQVQDSIQSATDAVQNLSPDEDRLVKAPDLQWEELWTKAHDELIADKSKLTWIKEYEDNLANLQEFQSPGQSEGFTINSESVGSIVAHLHKKREDTQWYLKWKNEYFNLNINLRKQVQKLVKVATWSDTLVKQALSTQPHAALAWCAATMVLPVKSPFQIHVETASCTVH
jgi:hypothetical protein